MNLNIRRFINVRGLVILAVVTFALIMLFANQVAGPGSTPTDWVLLAAGFTGLMVLASVGLAAILSYTGQGGWAVSQAQQLARAGQATDALARFDAILQRHPDQPQALIGRAALLLEQDRLPPALADLNRAIVQIPHVSNFTDPLLGQAYLQRGQVRELLGDAGGAQGDWERASRAMPNQVEPYLLRGRSELDQGHYYQGQALLMRAVKMTTAMLQDGAPAGAGGPSRTASRRGVTPTNDRATQVGLLNLRGMAYTLLDQPQRALADLEAALGIDSQLWAVHFTLAAAYLKLGHRDQALAALSEALRLHPAAAVAARRSRILQPLHDDPEFERLLRYGPRAA